MNKEFVDYYELLGLKETDTEEDMDFKYKEIVRFLNPDSHPDKTYSMREYEEVQEQLAGVNEAYRTLKDPKLREEYNRKYLAYKQGKVQESKVEVGIQRPVDLQPIQLSTPARKRRAEREPVVRNTPKEEKTFVENVKQAYKEVRRDERKNSFRKRHSKINEAYDETFAKKVNNIPKEIVFYTGKGTAHVFLEGFYQLSRLCYINKDSVTKYVIRNRRLIAAALATGIIFSSGLIPAKKKNVEAPVETRIIEIEVPAPTVEPTIVPSEEPRLVMTRNYTIVSGDTLSRLAYNANSSVEELKQINGYETDKIYSGRKMTIPYTILREDLEYYTESIKMNDFTVEEIARAYETDVETLYQLNRESIYYSNGTYYSLSDTLLVPVFHTKEEVKDLKEAKNASYE